MPVTVSWNKQSCSEFGRENPSCPVNILNKKVLLHESARGIPPAPCPFRDMGGGGVGDREGVPVSWSWLRGGGDTLSWSWLGWGGTPALGPDWGTPQKGPQGSEVRGYPSPGKDLEPETRGTPPPRKGPVTRDQWAGLSLSLLVNWQTKWKQDLLSYFPRGRSKFLDCVLLGPSLPRFWIRYWEH